MQKNEIIKLSDFVAFEATKERLKDMGFEGKCEMDSYLVMQRKEQGYGGGFRHTVITINEEGLKLLVDWKRSEDSKKRQRLEFEIKNEEGFSEDFFEDLENIIDNYADDLPI
jgi:DNA-binding PadR family transcriptional regulator